MTNPLALLDCVAADARGKRPGRVDILVTDGHIEQVGRAGSLAGVDADRLEASGCTVVPGLINMHEHLGIIHPGTREERALAGETREECLQRMERAALCGVQAGVTGMRLVGEPDGLDIELREAIAAAAIAGPRIWSARRPLDYVGGGRAFVGAIECSTVDECRRAAYDQIAGGADFLKLMLTGSVIGADPASVGFSLEQVEVVRRVARDAGVKLAVHTAGPGHPIMERLVDDGIDSLEHCYFMDPGLLERCVVEGTLLVLTPLVGRSPEYLASLELSSDLIERVTSAGTAHWMVVCSAVSAGARIALGTDVPSHALISGAPSVVRELELYEEAGADPATVLAIASRNGALWLGVGESLGLVEEGFEADLLVLEADPFVSGAAAYRQVRHVIARGRVVRAKESGQ